MIRHKLLLPVAVATITFAGVPPAAAVDSRPAPAGTRASSPDNTASTCPSVLFLGARGTMEYGPGSPGWPANKSPQDPLGLGPELVSLSDNLITNLTGSKTVGLKSVIFDPHNVATILTNTATYFAGLQAGVNWTNKYLAGQVVKCPQQQIVLAGYSEGAMVMHRILRLLSPAILAKVSAVVLIGDGDQVPYDNVTRLGTASLSAEGVGLYFKDLYPKDGSEWVPFNPAVGPRVISVCNSGDIVCATTSADLNQGGVTVHTSYSGTQVLIDAGDLAAIITDTKKYTGTGIDHPQGITVGPDHNLWFANSVNNSIGRITPNGKVTNFTAPGIDDPVQITAGPDGALWFTNFLGSSIGRITTSGTLTNIYTGPAISLPSGITAGPDGALWFTDIGNSSIGRITTSGQVTSYPDTAFASPDWITAGPDGNLWFTDSNGYIGQITPQGQITNYTAAGVDYPQGITTGPDGNLWFTNEGDNSIGQITPQGQITIYYGNGIDQPYGITSGPDGALWFTNSGDNSIGRISTGGITSSYTAAGIDGPFDITSGPDWSLWFTNAFNNSIGRNAGGQIPLGGSWSSPVEVPAAGTLNAGNAEITSVSCASAGNCTAGGFYHDSSGNQQAFVATETNGTWGTAQEAAANLNVSGNAQVTSVSCASAGNCTAGGYYTNDNISSYTQAFLVSEVNGTWSTAVDVPGLASVNVAAAGVTSVSCASAGNCSAGGYYTDAFGFTGQEAFVVSEVNGAWGTYQQVAANLNGLALDSVTSVSCASAGNCSAGGYYGGAQAFVVSEVNGTWAAAAEVPGSDALNVNGSAQVSSVSCASAGNCTAGGYYDGSDGTQAFVVSEVNGSWDTAIEVPGSDALNVNGSAQVTSVSCASTGNCTAGGYYTDASGNQQAFAINETSGNWGGAVEIPATNSLNAGGKAEVTSLSCPSANNCTAGGYYTDGSEGQQAFIVNESAGIWSSAEQAPGTNSLNVGGNADIASVSCASVGNCSAGGYYTDTSGNQQGFLMSSTSS